MEKITCSKNNGKELQFNCAQYRETGSPEGSVYMSEEEMQEVLSQMTRSEKIVFYELLSALSQSPSHVESRLNSDLSIC